MTDPSTRSAGRVLVVGGGAFGLSAAIELSRRGWSVQVLDAGPVPHPRASSTDVSKIVRMDYGDDPFFTDMARAAIERWEAWNRAWDRPLYHADGLLLLRQGTLEPGTFEGDSWRLLTERGVPLERLDAAGGALRRRFPAWNADLYPDGYFNPRAGWAESGAVVGALADEARRTGVQLRENARVVRVLERGGVHVAEPGGATHDLPADHVVVAAGAWTPTLLPELADLLVPVAQSVLHLRTDRMDLFGPPVFPPWCADISRTGWYGFPSLPDGSVKVGHHGVGRVAHPDEPIAVEDAFVARCRDFLRGSLPALADAPVVHRRVCFYCDAFDGAFWIDRHPDRPGLVVAAGGSGHGFKFAPLLGGVIADAVEGRDNRWGARFRWRARGPDQREDARLRAGAPH